MLYMYILYMYLGNRADVMVRCTEPGEYFLLSRPVRGSLTSLNTTSGGFGTELPVLGYDPLFQGIIGDIVVVEGNNEPVELVPFMPIRPPMLQNTSDFDLPASLVAAIREVGDGDSDNNNGTSNDGSFKQFDLLMSSQPDVILEPAQLCFVNGLLFNESQAEFSTKLDSLNEFRIAGIIQHPFHQHTNSFQINSLIGNIPDIYGGYFQEGDWHDTLFLPPREGSLNISSETSAVSKCASVMSPDGIVGRYPDNSCCCPHVSGSGCGPYCRDQGEESPCEALPGGRYSNGSCCCPAARYSQCGEYCSGDSELQQYSQIVNATLRWWAMNYTGYSAWHCHFVNHEGATFS